MDTHLCAGDRVVLVDSACVRDDESTRAVGFEHQGRIRKARLRSVPRHDDLIRVYLRDEMLHQAAVPILETVVMHAPNRNLWHAAQYQLQEICIVQDARCDPRDVGPAARRAPREKLEYPRHCSVSEKLCGK